MNGLARLAWEIIVVDNNSQDDTGAVVEEFRTRAQVPVVRAFEAERGLSNARNRGLREAKGELLVFTDDDVVVDENWLMSIVGEFDADAALSLIGGRVELYDPRDQPVTIRTSRERTLFFCAGQLFSLLPGCNMALHRRVCEAVGWFDAGLGAGMATQAADDSDYCYRVFKAGFKMMYCPDVLVYHNHGRRTDEQVRDLRRGYVIGRGAFYCKHILRGDVEILRMAGKEVVSLMRALARQLLCVRFSVKEMAMLRSLLLGAVYRVGTEWRMLLERGRTSGNIRRVQGVL